MMHSKRRTLFALATFVGTVMGVGLFGLPYVGARAGFGLLVAYLLFGGAIAFTINRMYASVATHTGGMHRLPGYAALYLGRWGKPAALTVELLALYGALLGYLIVGGQFLANLFEGSVILYTFLFFIVGAFLIWQGARSVGPMEFILLLIFLGVILFLFWNGAGHVLATHFKGVHWNHFFLPYGVVIFSLWGASIIPEVKELLSGDLRTVLKVIGVGLLVCVCVYLSFSFLVIGVSGADTTADALSGLSSVLGPTTLKIGFIFGIITTFTSFVTLGMTVQKLFWYDYRLSKFLAWSLATFVPLLLFIAGLQDFISVIGMTGAVMLGLDGVLITLIFLSLKRRQQSRRLIRHRTVGLIVAALLLVGVVMEIFYSLSNTL